MGVLGDRLSCDDDGPLAVDGGGDDNGASKSVNLALKIDDTGRRESPSNAVCEGGADAGGRQVSAELEPGLAQLGASSVKRPVTTSDFESGLAFALEGSAEGASDDGIVGESITG